MTSSFRSGHPPDFARKMADGRTTRSVEQGLRRPVTERCNQAPALMTEFYMLSR